MKKDGVGDWTGAGKTLTPAATTRMGTRTKAWGGVGGLGAWNLGLRSPIAVGFWGGMSHSLGTLDGRFRLADRPLTIVGAWNLTSPRSQLGWLSRREKESGGPQKKCRTPDATAKELLPPSSLTSTQVAPSKLPFRVVLAKAFTCDFHPMACITCSRDWLGSPQQFPSLTEHARRRLLTPDSRVLSLDGEH